MTSHLTVTVTPAQAGVTGITSQGTGTKAATPLGGFGSMLDAFRAIEAAIPGAVAGAAPSSDATSTAAATPGAVTGTPAATGFLQVSTASASPAAAAPAAFASLTETSSAGSAQALGTELIPAVAAGPAAARTSAATLVRTMAPAPMGLSTIEPVTATTSADPAVSPVPLQTLTASATATAPAAGDTTLLDALGKLLPQKITVAADGTVSVPLAATAAPDGTAAPDPTAPADAATAPATDAGTPPKLLHDLVSALSDLDKAEQSGAPVDKDLLKRVKHAIDALSSFLATQQPGPMPQAVPPSGDSPAAAPLAVVGAVAAPAAPIAGPAPPSTSDSAPADDTRQKPQTNGEAAKAQAVDAARLALGGLVGKIETLSTTVAKDQPDLATRLNILAKALDPKSMPQNTLADLGLDASSPTADPKLAAIVNGFSNGKTLSVDAAQQPVLATPVLKLPKDTSLVDAPSPKAKETGIGHKALDADAAAAPAVTATARPAAAVHSPSAVAQSDTAAKPSAPVPGAAVVQQATDKPADAAASAAAAGADAAATIVAPTTPIVAHAALRQVQDAYQAAASAPVNLPQMAFEIVRHAQQGSNHFQIRLDPADLGRVDVKLSVDAAGSVSAHLTVERSETLDLLKRDAGSLGQALTQAGLDGSKTNLQFSLSQNPFTRQDNPGSGTYSPTARAEPESGPGDPIPAAGAALYRGIASPTGLNIFV